MKKIICILLLSVIPGLVFAAEDNLLLEHANTELSNTASLQRGAKYFVNYCMGCHTLKYERWKRLGSDLHISERSMERYLMFTTSKSSEMMINSMPDIEASKWFGKAPPDLSLETRLRGVDWVYTYLKSFYIDPTRPTGVNNPLLPNAAMPDVFWKDQGMQKAVFKVTVSAGGSKHQEFDKFESVSRGDMTPEQFDGMVRDITNFLDYIGEPVKLERESLGIKVILFLIVFFLFAYMLKREMWKDIH